MGLTFYIFDVFAERKYAGNQLAVFRNARGLSARDMQAIAMEMHYSETTFVLSDEPRAGGFDVRIFTPREEVPFAGHPTLGTSYAIRNEILRGQVSEVVLNLKVGPIRTHFDAEGYCWMRQNEPSFGPQHSPAALAGILGLPTTDVDERLPVEEVSTGLPFFIVPLRSLRALKAARVDLGRYYNLIEKTESKGIVAFCPEPHEADHQVSVRVFVDYYGVPEDPATGSGNGCLAAYLARHSYFGSSNVDISAGQGYEIGRSSLLRLRASEQDERLVVMVGGRVVKVAEGQFV